MITPDDLSATHEKGYIVGSGKYDYSDPQYTLFPTSTENTLFKATSLIYCEGQFLS